MLVVSFYTDNYLKHANRLIESLDKLKIPHDIQRREKKNSWEETCNLKPEYLIEMVQKHNRALLWLDSDAEVLQYPYLFDNLEQSNKTDIAYHTRRDQNRNELLSGTLYFGNTLGAKAILALWYKLSKSNPKTWDQALLQKAVQNVRHSVYDLPAKYVRIFDQDTMGDERVIVHHQASRECKAD